MLGRLETLRPEEARYLVRLDLLPLAFVRLLDLTLLINLPLGRPIQVTCVAAALVVAASRLEGRLPALALQVEHRRAAAVVVGQTPIDIPVGIDVEVAHAGRTQHIAGKLERHVSTRRHTPYRTDRADNDGDSGNRAAARRNSRRKDGL